MDVEIQTTHDYQELARLNESVQTWHHQHYPDEFKSYNRSEVESAFENLLQGKNVFAFLAKAEGEAVGYILGYIRTRPDSAFQYEKRIFNIDQIAVLESYRKSGVGQQLLEVALGLAEEKGISEVQLDHWSGNELAERFFSKHGFIYFNHRMRK